VLSSDVLDAGRECAACGQVLQDLVRAIAPAVELEPSAAAAARAVDLGTRWARRVYAIGKVINIALSVAFVSWWIVFVELAYRSRVGFQFPAGNLARAVTVIIAVSALGYLALHGRVRDGTRDILYSRWEGRQLQGICAGLAAYFAVPRWLVRLGFLALFFAGLGGGTIYFLLAFLISFHPDDRRHLHWFKVQRWWRRRRGIA
jgi:phage shock protein PspC (stress-responsive transcriptional regulator)